MRFAHYNRASLYIESKTAFSKFSDGINIDQFYEEAKVYRG